MDTHHINNSSMTEFIRSAKIDLRYAFAYILTFNKVIKHNIKISIDTCLGINCNAKISLRNKIKRTPNNTSICNIT